MRMIRCWMTQTYRINNNKCEFERNDIVNEYSTTKRLRAGSLKFTDWYSGQVVNIFNPCKGVVN